MGLNKIGEVKMAKIIINALSNGCVRENEAKVKRMKNFFPF